jgi:IBR domain, a half RING-finger domain
MDDFRSSPASWSVDEVASWATAARLARETVTALVENEVDGPTLVTLTKADLQFELQISSLPARRYLWELLKNLKSEQETSDLNVAVKIHEEEINALADTLKIDSVARSAGDADIASGGFIKDDDMSASIATVVDEMASDAQTRRQMLEDRLYAFRVQRSMNNGEMVCEDAVLAHREQERLNELQAQSERDREYAETLATGRELSTLQARRRREGAEARLVQQNLGPTTGRTESRVASLFGLCVQTCASNKVNVAEAFQSGKVKPISLQDAALMSDEESSALEDDDDTGVGETDMSLGELPIIDECSVCYDNDIRGYNLACNHNQCIQCTRKLFKMALRDTTLLPLRCCEVPIDMNIASQLLGPKSASLIVKRSEERTAKNKMYCPTCTSFLNLDLIANTLDSNDFVCDCGTNLCLQCKTTAHPGILCSQNLQSNAKLGSDDSVILALSREQGWKQCPECAIMIELQYGCNHMSCINCSHEFCYRCLRPWSTKDAKCSSGRCDLWDEDRLLEAGELRVQQEEAQRGRALPQAIRRERLQHAVAGLRANEICIHEWTRSGGYKGDCPNCGFTMYAYGMRCRSDCGSTVCYTCAHHRIPQRGWR